jgi:hypothetical protein
VKTSRIKNTANPQVASPENNGTAAAPPPSWRDTGPYSARNSSKGALIDEAGRVFMALARGNSLETVRDQVLQGGLLPQRSRENRERIWTSIHTRYLIPSAPWLTARLAEASTEGPHSQEFVSLLYLLYALRDRLTFDFVTGVLWPKGHRDRPVVSRNHVLDLLKQAADQQPQIDRIRTRYEFIGRKTGAPFLAVVYPPEVERAVLHEWRTQCSTLYPEIDVRPVDVLEVTHNVITEIGATNIVSSMSDPMPGSDPQAELGGLWISAVAETVESRLSEPGTGKPVVSLERLAALYPAAGPRDVMQRLWDSAQSALNGPVVMMIPGHVAEARTYSFVGKRDEFMYRGDLL